MDQPLLQTKFLIPHLRPRQVTRPRLVEILNAGRHRKLTLLSAPAGFGKTTLLSNWVRAQAAATGWITIQEEDNDPARFLACLAVALHPEENHPASPESSARPEAALARLINGITAAAGSILLVLDDYHLIVNPAVHGLTDFLLENLPPPMHLVISTRADPPIALPRMRARDEVTEIDPDLLRLSFPEAESFLNQVMELNLPAGDIRILENRCEGWITGLQLAALSLRETRDHGSFIAGFAGGSRHITDYLTAEVISRLPGDIRDFLLRTSFLRRLQPDLCSAVLGDPWDSARCRETLEYLEASNIFTAALDERRCWFQYHTLFSQYLQDRIRRERPEWEREMHHRAGLWYGAQAELEEAMHHALAIPDTGLAAHLLEQHGSRLLQDGRVDTMLGWLKQLPEEEIAGNPYLALGCGWVYLLRGNLDSAGRFLSAAEKAAESYRPKFIAQEKREIPVGEMRGDLAVLRAFLCQARGDPAGMEEAARQAREWIPVETGENRQLLEFNLGLMQLRRGRFADARDSFARAAAQATPNRFVSASAQSCEGDAWMLQGKLTEAEVCYHKAVAQEQDRGDDGSPSPPAFMGIVGLAQAALLRCEFAAANEYLDTSLEPAAQSGDPRALHRVFALRVQCALAAGDWTAAEQELCKAAEHTEKTATDFFPQLLATFHGYLDLNRGNPVAASARLEEMTLPELPDMENPLWTDTWPAYLLSIRIDLVLRKSSRALDTLKRLHPVLERYPSVVMMLDWYLHRALASQLRKGLPPALEDLRSALYLAESKGILLPFMNTRPDLDPLLRSAMAQAIHPDFVHRILSLRENDFARAAPLLTPRERQILLLLAEGLSSTDVSRRLVITVATTRSYIKEIYRKLEAHGRKEALETARQRGIL
ncbi:MAG: LuxR C-terminal-related transcriptional regulator [Anaerolineales bacterium]